MTEIWWQKTQWPQRNLWNSWTCENAMVQKKRPATSTQGFSLISQKVFVAVPSPPPLGQLATQMLQMVINGVSMLHLLPLHLSKGAQLRLKEKRLMGREREVWWQKQGVWMQIGHPAKFTASQGPTAESTTTEQLITPSCHAKRGYIANYFDFLVLTWKIRYSIHDILFWTLFQLLAHVQSSAVILESSFRIKRTLRYRNRSHGVWHNTQNTSVRIWTPWHILSSALKWLCRWHAIIRGRYIRNWFLGSKI